MHNLIPNIRNAARALIIEDGRILLLRKDGGDRGERFALPGGAQDLGETLQQALDRECLEEIGTSVEVLDLAYVADYFKPRETTPPSTRHLVEFLFRCRLPKGYSPHNGPRPDKHQVEVTWMELGKLDSIPLYANSLNRYLMEIDRPQSVYLGTVD